MVLMAFTEFQIQIHTQLNDLPFLTYGTVIEIARGITQILKGIWWRGCRRCFICLTRCWTTDSVWRPVKTSAEVGAVISSAKRYNQGKIKSTESKAECRLPHLQSS